jgi:hypothetical protein
VALTGASGVARGAALAALAQRLRDTFQDLDAIHAWLRAPLRALGGKSAREVLRRSDIDALNRALDALDAGIFI